MTADEGGGRRSTRQLLWVAAPAGDEIEAAGFLGRVIEFSGPQW